jgi:hypothetical protein
MVGVQKRTSNRSLDLPASSGAFSMHRRSSVLILCRGFAPVAGTKLVRLRRPPNGKVLGETRMSSRLLEERQEREQAEAVAAALGIPPGDLEELDWDYRAARE